MYLSLSQTIYGEMLKSCQLDQDGILKEESNGQILGNMPGPNFSASSYKKLSKE